VKSVQELSENRFPDFDDEGGLLITKTPRSPRRSRAMMAITPLTLGLASVYAGSQEEATSETRLH
jgi:hypothetical protein